MIDTEIDTERPILDPYRFIIQSEDAETLRDAVLAAFKSGADLPGINLSEADLSGADLPGINLSGANLSGANLSRADLSGANLDGANLDGANLSGANLDGANLSGANLSKASLSGAYLYMADLSEADLSGADLSWSSHNLISEILWRAAGTESRKMVAAYIGRRTDWCWDQWKKWVHPERDWAVAELVGWVKDGDDAPDWIRERAGKNESDG